MDAFTPMGCGGRDPYNTATTDANWFFLIAARDAERTRRFVEMGKMILKNPDAFMCAVKSALNKTFGKFGR